MRDVARIAGGKTVGAGSERQGGRNVTIRAEKHTVDLLSVIGDDDRALCGLPILAGHGDGERGLRVAVEVLGFSRQCGLSGHDIRALGGHGQYRHSQRETQT